MAHVERHDVVELDALVRRGGAQPLPVPRHLRHEIVSRQAIGRSGETFKKGWFMISLAIIQAYRCKFLAASMAAGAIVG